MAEMFTVRGDKNPRHNIPFRPVFDMAIALPFIVGLSLLRKKDTFLGVLGVLWLIIFLIPSYLTEGAPHFLRSTGILAILFIWPAIGIDALRTGLSYAYSRFASLVVAGGLLLSSLHATFHDYFLSNYLASAETYTHFDGEYTALTLHTNQLLNAGWTADNIAAKPLVPPSFTLWIQPGLWEYDEVRTFIAAAEPDRYPFFKTLSPQATLTPPFALILDPDHQAEWLSKVPPSTPLSVETIIISRRMFAIYRTPELLTRPYTIPDHAYRSLNATLPNGINWLSAEYPFTVTPGVPFDLTANFVAPTALPDTPYAIRFDVLGPDGSLVSESQDLIDFPVQSTFASFSFRQSVQLATPPGNYTLTATLINRATLQPESFLDSQGRRLNATLTLGTLEVLRPTRPPSLTALGLSNRTHFDFGPLTLLGHNFDRANARPGEPTFITLFFHADKTPQADLSFNLFTPYLPTSQWQAGDLFRFVIPVRIPAEAHDLYRFTL